MGHGDSRMSPSSGWAGRGLWQEGSRGMPEHLQRGGGCCCPDMSPSLERRRLRRVTSAPEDLRC